MFIWYVLQFSLSLPRQNTNVYNDVEYKDLY
jgi:hypothetical protein